MTEERGAWGSQLQYTLTVAGYVIGLGNLWRFPMLAFRHGGGAFLVPYVFCSLLCGMPLLFLELSIGQFTKLGPSKAFYVFRPAFQGIGWAMACVANMTCIYYNVIVAWCMIYIYFIVTGRTEAISSCGNPWNVASDRYCFSHINNEKCRKEQNLQLYFNGTCINGSLPVASHLTISASEQFFENYVLERSPSIDEFGGMNWKMLGCLGLAWLITGLALLHGVKLMGRLSYITSTVPYLIMAAFFIRAITLPGSERGIRFYLTEPAWENVFKFATWRDALNQICYSLGLGFGNLLSMASYNSIRHNCYRDACLFAFIDTFMSLFGGTTVFATLGVMSLQMDKEISEVVAEGQSLAFIAYPEAIIRLPLPWLWSFLFFFMIFLIGVSSQYAMAEGVATSFFDQFPQARQHRHLVVFAVCAFDFAIGILMCTRAGIYYFTLFNDYSASFGLCAAILAEVFMILISYGLKRWRSDMRLMFREPSTWLGRWFGPLGHMIDYNWLLVSPIVLMCTSALIIYGMFSGTSTYGNGADMYSFPTWTKFVGWTLGIIPAVMLPLFYAYNAYYFRVLGKPQSELFRTQPGHPTHLAETNAPKSSASVSDSSSTRCSDSFSLEQLEAKKCRS
ncbi:unnamed protein product, partial [Mesorhabditis spiculigera]